MKSILLIGIGRFGYNTAVKLNELRHEIMAIDINEERINTVMPYVTNAQIGDSTNEDFLRSLGVNNYDLCIVTIANDFQNSLITTSLLKELGAKFVVARASSEVHAKFLSNNGADHVIYPEKHMAEWTAITYSDERVFDYVKLQNNHAIYEVSVPGDWVGKSIVNLGIRNKHSVNILAVKTLENDFLTVNAETVLREGETILVMGKEADLKKCFKL